MNWSAEELQRQARIVIWHHKQDVARRLANAQWYKTATADAPDSLSHKEWARLSSELQAELDQVTATLEAK